MKHFSFKKYFEGAMQVERPSLKSEDYLRIDFAGGSCQSMQVTECKDGEKVRHICDSVEEAEELYAELEEQYQEK